MPDHEGYKRFIANANATEASNRAVCAHFLEKFTRPLG